jgi:hypothetical protein
LAKVPLTFIIYCQCISVTLARVGAGMVTEYARHKIRHYANHALCVVKRLWEEDHLYPQMVLA